MAAKVNTETKSRWEAYRKLLEARREELVQSVESQTRMSAEAGLQGASGDSADLATYDYTAELFGMLLQKQAGALEEVDLALQKIASGAYGKCDACGSRIIAKRLKAIPWARMCRQCQEEQDRRQSMRKAQVTRVTWNEND